MSEAYVDLSLIPKIKNLCVSAEKEMEDTITLLKKEMNAVSAGWKDQKAKEFEGIVNQCITSLKNPLNDLHRCDLYLQRIEKALKDYLAISLSGSQSPGQSQNSSSSEALGSNGGGGFFSGLFGGNIHAMLRGVKHNPIQAASSERSEQEIISDLGGGDKTSGSCSSLALAYAGNRAGYVVRDFRGGRSCQTFSRRSSIEQIANMDGVNATILRGTDDTLCVERFMTSMERGREYYLATGSHAAVVRMNENGNYQYLELQNGNPSENGWHPLTLTSMATRFRCIDNRTRESSNFLIELSSLQGNSEFLNLLGYINTAEGEQRRGTDGYER